MTGYINFYEFIAQNAKNFCIPKERMKEGGKHRNEKNIEEG